MKLSFSKKQKWLIAGTFVVAFLIHYFVSGNKEAKLLVKQLELGSDEARVRAATELGRLRTSRGGAIPALQSALRDDDPSVRAAASRALQSIDRDEAVEGLLAALEDRRTGVRLDATEALERINTSHAKKALHTVEAKSRARYERGRLDGWANDIRKEFKRKKDAEYKTHRRAYDAY